MRIVCTSVPSLQSKLFDSNGHKLFEFGGVNSVYAVQTFQ
jgi:hypothetical protein